MFEFCSDPAALDTFWWFTCYLTSPKHINLYLSVLVVLALLFVTAPLALFLGLITALAAYSKVAVIRWVGNFYIACLRVIPDLVLFLFAVIAIDQALEWIRHHALCPDWTEPIRQGSDFVVCSAAKLPQSSSAQWIHEVYGFILAVCTYTLIWGAYAGNVLRGALRAVPAGALQAADAFGMTSRQRLRRIVLPQMWPYALPGLTNLWLLLIKATSFLFLLGVEDLIYWARELGGIKKARYSDYPHGDWRIWYFGALMIFYLCMTYVSEKVLDKINHRVNKGQFKVDKVVIEQL